MGRELVVSHSDMNAAYDRGEAVPLADSISWLARYQDSWWVVYEGGWLRIIDDLVAADIDGRATRRTADAQDSVPASASVPASGAG
jgi:hypothetical protein